MQCVDRNRIGKRTSYYVYKFDSGLYAAKCGLQSEQAVAPEHGATVNRTFDIFCSRAGSPRSQG